LPDPDFEPRQVGEVRREEKASSGPVATALTYLESLARELKKPEAEVMTMAFEAGLRELWREHILGRYLQGEIPREQAIERVGIDWVDLAERQYAAMTEDLAWAQGD